MTQWVYGFGGGSAEGAGDMKNLLGGKGANLAEMSNLGLPVPPGFTLTTEVCTAYYDNGRTYPDELTTQVDSAVDAVGKIVGKAFGKAENPLLVSVRSGARASMPGMMDTVLNLGLNDETVEGLAKLSSDTRFAYDSYRRFIQMYSDVVLGVDHGNFEEVLDYYKDEQGYFLDTDMQADDWQAMIVRYKQIVEDASGEPFPQDVRQQLWGALGAVFGSWMNQRAETYRRLHSIPVSWGTAVNIQAMVFGNMGETSSTGVAFTRNPSNGVREFYGEFLINAQGEDVVAGIRTPQNLTKAAREAAGDDKPSMEEAMPDAFDQLVEIYKNLEAHYRDMQDIEFTVEEGKLWMLQTRSGKRTIKAALKIAVEMAEEGLISREEAIARIDPASLDQLLHPTLDPDATRDVVATGLPASPGAASGKIVFSADEAEHARNNGEKVVLVRIETSPEDIHGMHAAEGILTTRGGMTSHAAVVARGMGRPCVSGTGMINIDYTRGQMTVMGRTLSAGDIITIDGTSGQVMAGAVDTIQPELTGDFGTLMSWADGFRKMGVRTNAETPVDAQAARDFGAEGIGLSRTEHMFFDEDRIVAVREMVLSETAEGRRFALDRLLPVQREDFTALFKIMRGLPVAIRLLDPPLHEFLPHNDAEIEEVSRSAGVPASTLRARVNELHEFNPMLGHRGCRLGISYPEIYEMQARAIFEAAIETERQTGEAVILEVMIPLIVWKPELDFLKDRVDAVAAEVRRETGKSFDYIVGTMIEMPRASILADQIAETAEFFSFGTNDLTQTALGISRDDASSFLSEYERKGLIERDPFVTIDREGVGYLVQMGVERGRATREGLKCGICGEHGGDPASVAFCHEVDLDYVSCSPFRVPIARLAAAQAALADGS